MKVSNLLLENTELKALVEKQEEEIENLKLIKKALRRELNEIKSMSMFEFAEKYCKEEELEKAGHDSARSLGVGMK